MLVKQVVAIAFDHELEVFAILAHANFVPDGDIGLQVRIGAGVRHDTVLNDVAGGGIAMELSKVAASLSPLARGRCANHRQARTDRGSFVEGLRDTERRFLTEPGQPIVAPYFCGMRTIGCERTVIDLAARQVRHRWKIESAAVIR